MRKRASTKGKIIIAALLICLSASYFYSWKDDVMRKFVYPLQYDYLVRQYAYEDKVDPALVASVILVESKFDERRPYKHQVGNLVSGLLIEGIRRESSTGLGCV